jgi:hypothetical protein
MFAMLGTRFDIAFAVSTVAKFSNQPQVSHVNAVKRIFRYLIGTKDHKLCFSGSNDSKHELVGYCDSDYAGDINTRRNTNGYVFRLNNGPISWCSQRQKSVSLSTTEAEFVAACNATKHAIWSNSLLKEMNFAKDNSIPIYSDNQSAIKLIHNPEFHKRSKHIDVQYHFIREKQSDGLVNFSYIDSNNQLADIFTKALPFDKFARFRSQIGLEA